MIIMTTDTITVMLLLMLKLPESPRWLVSQDDHQAAREVLRRIRPDGADVEVELQEIMGVVGKERQAGSKNRGWRGLRKPWVRPALLVGCGIAMFTQLSGIVDIVGRSGLDRGLLK